MIDSEQSIKKGLSNEQKIGLVLLSAFAIMAIGLGVLQIRNTMYSHFALNNQVPDDLKDQVNTADALRFRDTDRDGLSDFDELYIYGTSQYIADTDSDGVSDGEEVRRGINPNCAEGKDCGYMSNEAPLSTSTITVGASTDLVEPTVPPVLNLETAIQDPQQVRQMLIAAGVSADVINKVSDADLMKMINELMVSSSTNNNIQVLNNSVSTTTKK